MVRKNHTPDLTELLLQCRSQLPPVEHAGMAMQ